MSKDYYKILNIEKNASEADIKTAFRKLAHQYHPDKEGGDEAKFKEINEAYQVLGNPEKRRQFDQYGATFDQQGGFGGGMNWEDFMNQARGGGFSGANFDFGGIDLGDIFGDIFGFGGGGRGGRNRRGSDIQASFTIDFKESVFGVKKTVELYKTASCEKCGGSGAEQGSQIKSCGKCNGSGRVTETRRTFFGAFQTAAVCPDCGGEGRKPEKSCSACSGRGAVKRNEKIEIEIPAGIENRSAVRLEGKGEAGERGAESGDLYLEIRVKPDSRFERHGDDILMKQKISMAKAALGTEIMIETLDGQEKLQIPAGTQPNAKIKIKNKGVPHMRSSGRGDLYVEISVEIPERLSRHQRELLEKFDE
jgi:molecular chaperone DnaJ